MNTLRVRTNILAISASVEASMAMSELQTLASNNVVRDTPGQVMCRPSSARQTPDRGIYFHTFVKNSAGQRGVVIISWVLVRMRGLYQIAARCLRDFQRSHSFAQGSSVQNLDGRVEDKSKHKRMSVEMVSSLWEFGMVFSLGRHEVELGVNMLYFLLNMNLKRCF